MICLSKSISAVYKITCLKNGKVYIGASSNIKNRFMQHERELKKNVHKNKEIQEDFNKYGVEQFKFEILEVITDDRVFKYERKHMLKYQKTHQLYNVQLKKEKLKKLSTIGVELSLKNKMQAISRHEGKSLSVKTEEILRDYLKVNGYN